MRRRWFSSEVINTFGILGLFKIVKDCISEATAKPYEAGSIENNKLFDKDLNKVRFGEMTQRELDKNIKSGKYRDYSPPSDYDLWNRRIKKYIELFPNKSHTMEKIHLDYIKQQRDHGWKLDESILWKYKDMDKYL